MITATPTAYEWRDDAGQYVSAEVYHGTTSILGNSIKEEFIESRKVFHGRYVAKTLEPKKRTEAMDIGVWSHIAVLENDVWRKQFIAMPECASSGKPWDLRTSAHKAEQAELRLMHGNRTVIDLKHYVLVSKIREAVYANPVVRALLEQEGIRERPIVWRDPATGLLCKNRQDHFTGKCIADLKTADGDISPAGFQRIVTKRNYQRNADFYVRGNHALSGEVIPYVFIVVSKSTFECALYVLEPEWLADGREQNDWALGRLAECMESGDWTSPHERQITTIERPRYASSPLDWEDE